MIQFIHFVTKVELLGRMLNVDSHLKNGASTRASTFVKFRDLENLSSLLENKNQAEIIFHPPD
jgi:hypothetical protein